MILLQWTQRNQNFMDNSKINISNINFYSIYLSLDNKIYNVCVHV